MFGLFSRRKYREDWNAVYSTRDPWEAEVVRAALLSENIPAVVKTTKGDKRTRENVVSVPDSKVKEAQMVIYRTSVVISQRDNIIAEQEERASSGVEAETYDEVEQPVAPEAKTTGEPVLLAEKDDVGEIFYYEEEDRYELRLNMESYKQSHFMPGDEWEEFIDFSAQRQEFFILLKEKYPKLAAYLKENKMRPSFLKLIEYSYGKSQPPKKKQ
jgi:hypothetical protein